MPLILCTFDEYHTFRGAVMKRCRECALDTCVPERLTTSEAGLAMERLVIAGTMIARALYDLDENVWTCEVDVRTYRLLTEAIPFEAAHNEPLYVCRNCLEMSTEQAMVSVMDQGSGVEVLRCPSCGRVNEEPLYFCDEKGDPIPSFPNHPPGFFERARRLALLCLVACFLIIGAGCGSPRHDGVPWERTEPHQGDSIADVDALYGRPESIEAPWCGRIVRHYKHWRAKNQLGGLDPIFSKRDHHTVFFNDGRAVEWNDQP